MDQAEPGPNEMHFGWGSWHLGRQGQGRVYLGQGQRAERQVNGQDFAGFWITW